MSYGLPIPWMAMAATGLLLLVWAVLVLAGHRELDRIE